jgi:LPPG:FO 2-phospho-L-lactate transferase
MPGIPDRLKKVDSLLRLERKPMKITALAGGVGAAKFLSGLVRVVPAEDITIIVNTGDDFRWLGLYICPDLDTVTYTLAGLANSLTGWGVRDESFRCLERLRILGCETWFALGDLDLATHLYRTYQLNNGRSLTEITALLSSQNGLSVRILPMTDSYVPTMVHTEEGILGFQDYFVHKRCTPQVRQLSFAGIENASSPPGVLAAIYDADAIVLCPSNPLISIAPILAVPGIRPALKATSATILAVSPLVSGQAIKGPAASLMRQLGHEATAAGVAMLYRDLIDIFVLDRQDQKLQTPIADLGLRVYSTDTIMTDMVSKTALATAVLEMLT